MSTLKVNKVIPVAGTQVSVGADPDSDPSVILNVQSTTQGFSLPRMTTAQRNAIPSPSEGLLVYNTDDHRLEQYSSGTWTVAGNGQQPIVNVLRVIKNSVLNSGDFSSVAAAIASISTNSPTNQFIISVGPGVFVEPQLQMKPYVWVVGQSADASVIEASDVNNHLILGTEYSGIVSCALEGVTLSGKALIYYGTSTATSQTAFWAEDIAFRNADTLAIADGFLSPVNLQLNRCKFGGQYQFNTGFVSRTNSASSATLIIRNSTSQNMASILPADLFVVDGAGCKIEIDSIVAITGGTGGNCVRARNGGIININGLHADGWAKGLWVENVGAASSFFINSAAYDSNTIDIQVDHATSEGSIVGSSASRHKIVVNAANNTVAMDLVDPGLTEQITVGTNWSGPDFNNIADISTLLAQSTGMGLLVGGGSTYGALTYSPGSLVVTAEAGIGYVMMPNPSLDPLTFFNVVRKIPWPDESITLPANSQCWVYYDNTATLQFTTGPQPDNIYNVIMGRVVTNATDIEFAEESGVVSEHVSNYLGEALRKGLGPVYNAGSTAVELGTRTLQIAAGDYYYGERHFQAQGGTPITFNSYYQNGSGGFTRVPTQTVVDNANYDNGTGTLAPIGAGNYAKHSIYLMGDGSGSFLAERYFLVYSQAQYTSLTLAEQGALPNPPATFGGAMALISSVIVQQGVTHLTEIRDERPLFSAKRVSSVSATTFHHNLLGLNDFDDHLRYLPVDGSRAMTANLPMGGFGLTSMLFAASNTANPAATGVLRLANLDAVKWRNFANSADLGLFLDASNIFQLGSALTVAGNINNSTFSLTTGAVSATSVTSGSFISSVTNPASAGAVRLANLDFIKWRNAGNTADLGIQLDATDIFQFGSAINSSGNITGANLSGTNTGDVTLAAVGAVPNANAASLSGQALTLQPASPSFPGVVTAGTQNLGGLKSIILCDSTVSGGTVGSSFVNSADNTKVLKIILSAMTSARTLSLAVNQSTTQTLNVPNITATDTLAVLGLAQTWTQANTFSSTIISNAFISSSANPAATGNRRLANLDAINWRNAGNTADLGIFLDASNIFQIGSSVNISGTDTATAFISATANPASSGILRLANTESIQWRNAANSANHVMNVDASDVLHVTESALQINLGSATTTKIGLSMNNPQAAIHFGSLNGNTNRTSGTVGLNSVILGGLDATHNVGQGAFIAGGTGGPNYASGQDSCAIGFNDVAAGIGAAAIGYANNASGNYTSCFGAAAHAAADGSCTLGYSAQTTDGGTGNQRNVAIGESSLATGNSAVAIGLHTTAQGFGQLVLGAYNIVAGTGNSRISTDDAFIVGNGTSIARSNAFSVSNDGKMKIWGTVSGFIAVLAAATTTSYTLTMPGAQGAVDAVQRNDGTGVMSWIVPAAASTISTNANSIGTAAGSYAKADHLHQLTAGSAVLDSVPQFDNTNWQAIPPEQLIQPSRAYSLFDEFIAGVNTGSLGWTVSTVGGGSTITVGAATAASNHPGVFRLTTGANAGANASLLLAQSGIVLGGGAMNLETDINIGTLSTGAQTYVVRFGVGDSGGADFTNGVYFEYNTGTSTNWVIKTAAAGTRTSTTTTTAVATGWTKLTIQINASGSSAQFFVNGTSVGTISTNLPTAASGFAIQNDGVNGNATKSIDVDYFTMNQRFTTAR